MGQSEITAEERSVNTAEEVLRVSGCSSRGGGGARRIVFRPAGGKE